MATEPIPPDPAAYRAALARVRHDLLTPLNGVIGYAALLEEEAAEAGLDAWPPAVAALREGARALSAAIAERVRAPDDPEAPRPGADTLAAALEACCGAAARGLREEAECLLRAAGPADQPLVPDLRAIAESAAALVDVLAEAAPRLEAALRGTP